MGTHMDGQDNGRVGRRVWKSRDKYRREYKKGREEYRGVERRGKKREWDDGE